jgi:Flp pilus assembly pilin Flp
MDEAGASAVEYSLFLALIAMVILIAVTNFGQTLSNMFVNFATTITTAMGS